MKSNNESLIDKEESEANLAITNLISNIAILVTRKDHLIKCVRSPNLLMRGLTELKNMVEMIDIKHAIVKQIKFLISNQARKKSNEMDIIGKKFEGHMLHCVISGKAGTGKSTCGMILAKIWMALGFVNKKEDKKDEKKTLQTLQITTNQQLLELEDAKRKYDIRVAELEEAQRNDHRKIDKVKELLTRYHNVSGEIRRSVLKLRPVPSNLQDIDIEWGLLINHTRELRFGFDEIIRETNQKFLAVGVKEVAKVVEDVDPYENCDPKFIIAAREDLVAEYLGQTAPKTKKILESARGGVLFIDEAYSLCNMDGGSKDKYGEECLTTINEFMSLYPDEIIIIFAGYKDKLMSSIFKAQPGLLRRCAYFFEIKDYTPKGLSKIFSRQLSKNLWILAPDIDVEKILSDNKNIIQDGGGGTEKLAFFVKTEYGTIKFQETIDSTTENPAIHDSIITRDMIKAGLEQMKNQVDDRMLIDPCPSYMYT